MGTDRYSRQTSLDRIGNEGQKKLSDACVTIIGCGGLGAIAGVYLAGAGIGKIKIIDADIPSESNLHRQVFYSQNTTSSKSDALKNYINQFNPEINVISIPVMLNKSNALEVIKETDIVIECTDQIQVKYLINDACLIQKIPMVYGAIHKYDGYVSFFRNKEEGNIHLRDIFPEPDNNIPSCEEVGVMNTLAGIIGLLQANEAIKFISGAGPTLEDKLLIYDIINNSQMKMKLKKSWKIDILETWASNSYKDQTMCDIPEISVNDFIGKESTFTVVSILNNSHHKNISEDTIHMPASEFNIYEWEPDEIKPTVIYCRSGKVSLQLAISLKEEYPECEFYSLKGGIKAFEKLNNADQG